MMGRARGRNSPWWQAAKRVLAGEIFWSLSGNLAVQVVNFAIFLWLARLLGPEPYGIVGFAAVALAVAWSILVEGGAEFLTRAPSLSRGHANAAFWLQLGLSLPVVAMMVIGLGALAHRAGEPELGQVVSWLAVVPFCYALAATHRALMQRALRFRALAVCSFASALAGGTVGIAAALQGKGAMSLAWMMLTQSGSFAGFLWLIAGFRPTFHFHRGELRDVLGFGGHMVTAGLLSLAELQGSRLLIGLSAGPIGLGLFTMGWRIVEVISTLVLMPVTQVAAPTLAALQHDRAAFAQRLGGFMRLALILALPAYAGLLVMAPIMIRPLFGPQWDDALVPLQILCILGVGWAVSYPLNAALMSMGLMAHRTRVSLLGLAVTAVGVGTTAWLNLGVDAIAAVFVMRQIVVVPAFCLPLVRRRLLRIGALASDVGRLLLSTVLMMSFVLAANHWLPGEGMAAVLLGIAIGATTYAAAILVLARETAHDASRMLLPVQSRTAAELQRAAPASAQAVA
jgi:PST family polysaccharide transporter